MVQYSTIPPKINEPGDPAQDKNNPLYYTPKIGVTSEVLIKIIIIHMKIRKLRQIFLVREIHTRKTKFIAPQ